MVVSVADADSAMDRPTVVKSNVSFCMLDPFVFEVFSVLGIFVGLLSEHDRVRVLGAQTTALTILQ